MKLTISDIKNLIDQCAEKINAPKRLLPTYGYPVDTGSTDIEIDINGQIYYFPGQRNRDRFFLRDTDDLLYYVFNNVTQVMATEHALLKGSAGEDNRRTWFVEQERLLGVINKDWELRKIKEHEQTLLTHPFRR